MSPAGKFRLVALENTTQACTLVAFSLVSTLPFFGCQLLVNHHSVLDCLRSSNSNHNFSSVTVFQSISQTKTLTQKDRRNSKVFSWQVDVWCWSNIVRQCIPDVSSSNQKGLATEGWNTVDGISWLDLTHQQHGWVVPDTVEWCHRVHCFIILSVTEYIIHDAQLQKINQSKW